METETSDFCVTCALYMTALLTIDILKKFIVDNATPPLLLIKCEA